MIEVCMGVSRAIKVVFVCVWLAEFFFMMFSGSCAEKSVNEKFWCLLKDLFFWL